VGREFVATKYNLNIDISSTASIFEYTEITHVGQLIQINYVRYWDYTCTQYMYLLYS